MEFEVNVGGDLYHFMLVEDNTYLVNSDNLSLILYKSGNEWRCADTVPRGTINALGKVIESHQTATSAK